MKQYVAVFLVVCLMLLGGCGQSRPGQPQTGAGTETQTGTATTPQTGDDGTGAQPGPLLGTYRAVEGGSFFFRGDTVGARDGEPMEYYVEKGALFIQSQGTVSSYSLQKQGPDRVEIDGKAYFLELDSDKAPGLRPESVDPSAFRLVQVRYDEYFRHGPQDTAVESVYAYTGDTIESRSLRVFFHNREERDLGLARLQREFPTLVIACENNWLSFEEPGWVGRRVADWLAANEGAYGTRIFAGSFPWQEQFLPMPDLVGKSAPDAVQYLRDWLEPMGYTVSYQCRTATGNPLPGLVERWTVTATGVQAGDLLLLMPPDAPYVLFNLNVQ